VHDGVPFIEAANTVEAINAPTAAFSGSTFGHCRSCCTNGRDARSKGLAIYEDKLYAPTADGHVVA
jgi:hypothetical protein